MENIPTGDKVVQTIAHDPSKCPSTKIIQMAKFAGSDAPSITAILHIYNFSKTKIFGRLMTALTPLYDYGKSTLKTRYINKLTALIL